MQRLAITGANGFLGRAMCRLAAESGYEVVAVLRRPSEVPGAARVLITPLENTVALVDAFRGCVAVVHTAGLAHVFGPAALDEQAFHEANVRGTEAVAQAALRAGVPQFLLASSVSVYGGAGTPVMEISPVQPRTPYARSKFEAEQAASAAFAAHGCVTTLRFATIYGEGDRGNVSRLIDSLRRGRFVWPGSGCNRKSLIYCDDAARACLSAVGIAVEGVFNVSAEPVTMRAIVETICDALERPVPRVRIPGGVMRMAGSVSARVCALGSLERQLRTFLNDDVYLADSFRERFEWQPEVSLREGIFRQVQTRGR